MPPTPWFPATLGPYRLISPIGSGATATVFRAVALDGPASSGITPQEVAIKIVPLDADDLTGLRARATIELDAMRRLHLPQPHPNIVTVYDAGLATSDGHPFAYLVLELIAAGTLHEKMQRHAWSIPYLASLCWLMVDILDALDYCHRHHIIHRDLKPRNILIADPDYTATADAPYRRGSAKLTDFGIARLWDEPGITANRKIVGTPEYMAPELALGRPYGPRADIYAAGCVLYEALVGEAVFRVEPYSPMAVLQQHIRVTPPPPSEYSPLIPESLATIIMTMIAKSPNQRYVTAHAAARALSTCLLRLARDA